jgi:O-antigen/teichoic acid export membrane protein
LLLSTITNFFKNRNRNYVILTQVINAVIALISGKLIAIYILPEEFGVYSIQWATFILFATLLITPMIQFVKSTEKTIIPKIGTKYYIYTLVGIVFIAYISLLLFLHFYYGNLNIVLILVLLFFLPLYTINSILANFLNVQNDLISFSKLSLLRSGTGLFFIVLYFALNFSFLAQTEVLWIIQLSGVFLGFAFFISKYRLVTAKFKVAYIAFFKKYIRFAGPLMVVAFWAWINNYFDRYAIEYFLSIKDVGVYNASYSVGSKFFLMISPLFAILVTPTVFSNKPSKEKKRIMLRYTLFYSTLAIPVLIVIYFSSAFIGNILLSEKYEEGFFMIFWIALAFFMFTLAQLFELYFYSELQTKIILIGNVLSAVVNIILNIVLIPKLGILGAALATCLGFGIYLSLIYYRFIRQTE